MVTIINKKNSCDFTVTVNFHMEILVYFKYAYSNIDGQIEDNYKLYQLWKPKESKIPNTVAIKPQFQIQLQ